MSAPCPVLGFVIDVRYRPGASEADRAALVTDLLDALEAHGLDTDTADHGASAFVVQREGGQATHDDTEALRRWSTRWTSLAEIHVSDIVDLSA